MARASMTSLGFAVFSFFALVSPARASWVSPEIGEAHGITTPVIVDPATGAWAEQIHVRAASNGAGFLVVWSERDAAGFGDIWGARLAADGTVLDPDGFPIFVGPGDQRVPDVVWDGQSYFVVFESRLVDAGDLYGVHVSAAGVVLDRTPIPIAVGWAQQGYPAIEFDGTRYLVAWHGYQATPLPPVPPFQIGVWATAVTRAGEVLTPGGFLLVDAANGQAYPDIAYAAASQTFLVVWGDHRRTAPIPGYPDSFEWPPYDVYGMRLQLDAAGAPILLDSFTDSLPIHVGEQCDRRPRVATDGTDFLVADSCVNGPGTWDGTTVRMSAIAHRVTAGGAVSASADVSGGLGDAWGTYLAYAAPNFLVAWVDGAAIPSELRARRVSPAGAMLDPSPALVAPNARFVLGAAPPAGPLIFTGTISANGGGAGEALVGYSREQVPQGPPRARARLVDLERDRVAVQKIGDGDGTVSSSDGRISCGATCSALVATGAPVNLTAVPAAGSDFLGWSACTGTGACTVVSGEVGTVTAEFVLRRYTITASVLGGSGSITPLGATTVSAGASQSYAIAPAAGYRVNYVAVNGASVGAVTSYNFNNVQTNYTIKVDFVPITYTITVNQTPNGYVIPYNYSGFAAGASQTYNVRPNTGYHVADVLVDGISVGAVTSYPFANIQGNHTISATFAPNPSYTITATAGANGSIAPPGPTTLLGGQSQRYTITPSSGHRVGAVLVDGIGKGAITSYTFSSLSADHTIDASFVKDEYTITASLAGGSGFITPLGATTVAGGGSQTYNITPAAGYRINYVAVNGASVGKVSTYTFSNVRRNHEIKADFVAITYTITVTQPANGSITPYTFGGFQAGANQTYSIKANAGYQVSDVQVDGVSAGAVTSYPFTNITQDHTISATIVAASSCGTLCGLQCVNTDSDPLNCGSCGLACGAGQSCVGGACHCPAPQQLCGNACVNTNSDPLNCGSCGNVCQPLDVCSGGTCVFGGLIIIM